MSRRIVPVVIFVGLLVAALVYSQRSTGPLIVSGFIEADEMRLGSRVGGRVAEVLVEEGADVTPGQLLVRLEPYDLLRRLEETQANLAARRAELAKLESGFRPEEVAQAAARVERLKQKLKALEDGPRPEEIEAARASQRLAVAQYERARQTHERNVGLAGADVSAVSRDTLDRSQEELRVSLAQREVRDQELRLLEQGTRAEDKAAARAELAEAEAAWQLTYNGYRREEIEQASAAVKAAQAAADAIQSQIAELEVRSPAAGVVEALDLQPGDLAPPNAPVLTVVDHTRLWVRAYVPENRIPLRIGQTLSVTVDSFPDRTFSGRITFLARQAEFSPSNVQTPDERAKQVFRIKVTLEVPEADRSRLRPGMTANVILKEEAE